MREFIETFAHLFVHGTSFIFMLSYTHPKQKTVRQSAVHNTKPPQNLPTKTVPLNVDTRLKRKQKQKKTKSKSSTMFVE